MAKNIDNLPYRSCVGISLFNNDGKVFVGERIDTPGAWQMPQGGIDKGEDVEKAAFRELKEEVGTDKAKILRISDTKLRYDLPPHLLGRLWNGRYRGQEQTWIAMAFIGNDNDIDIKADKIPEFRDWKWVHMDELIDLVIPFKKDTYRQVIAAFSEYGS